jgi:hypothetical protein
MTSAFQQELDAAVHLVHEALADIDHLLRQVGAEDGYPLEDVELGNSLICRSILGDGSLQLIRDRLDTIIGERLGTYEQVIDGIGVVRRHKKKDRTSWDKPDLLRAVLDTKLVDTETGEIIDETPLSKVTTVWNLGAPRLTALRDRGLDPDDYCKTEVRPGWSIEVK